MTRHESITAANLKRLTAETVEAARSLCDEHVGAGLYTSAFLHSILGKREHYFFLIQSGAAYIGYIYYRLMTAGQIGQLPGFASDTLAGLCRPEDPIAVYISIGIQPSSRGTGVTDSLMALLDERIRSDSEAVLIVAPAWKKGDFVPAERLLLRNGFTAYCELLRPWENIATLTCPACGQARCQCHAVVYYRRVTERRSV